MAEILNPTGMMMSGGDGGLGFGSGGGRKVERMRYRGKKR